MPPFRRFIKQPAFSFCRPGNPQTLSIQSMLLFAIYARRASIGARPRSLFSQLMPQIERTPISKVL